MTRNMNGEIVIVIIAAMLSCCAVVYAQVSVVPGDPKLIAQVLSDDISSYEKEKISEFNNLTAGAVDLFEQGKYELSKEKFQRALKLDRANKEVKNWIEKCSAKSKKKKKLLNSLPKNAAQQNKIVSDKYNKGKSYYKKDQFARAKKAFEEIVMMRPDGYKQTSDYLKKINKKLDISSKIPTMTSAEKVDTKKPAKKEKKAAAKKEEDNRRQIKALLSEGKNLYGEKRYDKAIVAFNKVLALDKGDKTAKKYINKSNQAAKKQAEDEREKKVENFVAAGDRLHKSKDYDKAIGEYNKALQLDKANRSAKRGVADCKKEKAKLEQIKKELAKKKEEKDKREAQKQEELKKKIALENEQEKQQAEEKRKEIENQKQEEARKAAKKEAEKQKQEKKRADAQRKKDEEKALKEKQGKVEARLGKGTYYLKKKQYEDAQAEFRGALEIDPNNANAKKYLAEAERKIEKIVREKEQERIKAEKAADQKRKLEEKREQKRRERDEKKASDRAERLTARGIALYNKGELEQALDLLNEALDAVPVHSVALKYKNLTVNKIAEEKIERGAATAREAKEKEGELRFGELVRDAQALLDNEQYEHARDKANVALDIKPRSSEAKRILRESEKMLEEEEEESRKRQRQKERSEQVQKKQMADQLFEEGLKQYERKNIVEAVARWNDTVGVDPNHEKAKTYLRETRQEYEKYLSEQKRLEAGREKEEAAEKKMETPITYRTLDPITSLTDILDALSFMSGINFYIAAGVEAEVSGAKFDEETLTEVLDIILLPLGLKWSRRGEIVTIEPDLHLRMFKLTPDEAVKVKTLLEKRSLQKLIYGPDGVPKIRGVELEFDDRESILIIRDSAKHVEEVQAFLETLKRETPPELIVRMYTILEKEGPKIKLLIEALLKAEAGSTVIQEEQMVILQETNLVVKATPENITMVEQSLLDEGFIEKIADAELDIRVFDITPTEELLKRPEELQKFADDTVEVIKTFLYAKEGQKEARARGRRLWYDRFTLQITIVDSKERIGDIDKYINSLSQIEKRRKSEIVHLKHLDAGEMMSQLNDVLGIRGRGASSTGAMSVTKTLRRQDEFEWRGLRIRVRRINENDILDDSDDDVELIIRTGTQQRDVTITEFSSEFIDDFEINVVDVDPSATPGEGRAELEIVYLPPGEQDAALQAEQDRLLQQADILASSGPVINSFSETNTLLIRYTDPYDLEQILDWIEKLDIPILQVSIETKFVEVNETRAREYKAEWDMFSSGEVDFDFSAMTTRFGRDTDELRNMFEPSPEYVEQANLLKGTTVVELIMGGSSPLSLELSFLEAEGVINVISGPQITVMNGDSADFTLTQRYTGFLITTSSTSANQSLLTGFGFEPFDISISPTISQQGYITLEIDVTIIDIEGYLGLVTDFTTGTTGGVDDTTVDDVLTEQAVVNSFSFATREKELSTRAWIKDGGTIVLGGWTGQRSYVGTSGVPGLRNLPFIGKLLFSRSQEFIEKTTLLVFLTGRILQQ